MRPASAAFLRAVRSSHTMTARARLVPAGQTGTDPDGEEAELLDGDVQLDANAAVRGTADFTTAGDFPQTASDPLAPFGREVFLERGLKFGNGVTEWVSLGYFRLEDVEQNDAPEGTLRVASSDRMAGLADARLLAPVQFAAGTTLGSVVDQLVTEVYPAGVVEWDDATSSSTLGRPLVAEQDRVAFLQELVTAAGKVWFFDYRGVLVIRNPPAASEPVEQLDAGEGGVLVTMGRALSRNGVYNAVVATGEAPDTGTPARAVVVDDNPNSPTYFDGPFGPVPKFFSSPMITTDEQALAAAENLLRQELGVPYNVDLSAIPNPALEPLDPVTVAYPKRTKVLGSLELEEHVLEHITIPLTPDGALKAKTREQTLVTIGTRA